VLNAMVHEKSKHYISKQYMLYSMAFTKSVYVETE